MARELIVPGRMKAVEEHKGLNETFIGMAHIAGTGPEGKSCRECSFFGERPATDKKILTTPGHYGVKKGYALKPGRCFHPIEGKAKLKFPSTAKACRLFNQSRNPWPANLYSPENTP